MEEKKPIWLVFQGVPTEKKALSTWQKLQEEFISEFGVPDEYVKYINLKFDALEEYLKAFKGNKSRRNIGNVLNGKANDLLDVEEVPFFKQLAQVSKLLGFSIDPKNISVYQYYAYLKTLSDG